MHQALKATIVAFLMSVFSGCHDGPLYALKTINPVYRSHWAKDEKLGPTDYQRRVELQRLVRAMPNLSDEDQAFWVDHVKKILEHDKNAEMRMLAIRALSGYRGSDMHEICQQQFDDSSEKVRMAICDVLGEHDASRSVELLAESLGSEENVDVRMAAIRGLGKQSSEIAAEALRGGLSSRDPAVRLASVESLKGCTGRSLGDDPKVWIAFLDGEPVDPEQPAGLTERLRGLF